MSRSQTTQEIKQTLAKRKAEIERELCQIENALQAFQAEQPKPAKRKRRKRRRIDTEKVMSTVKTNPGMTGRQVARKMSLPTSSAYRALERLKDQERVAKYGSSWYPAERSVD